MDAVTNLSSAVVVGGGFHRTRNGGKPDAIRGVNTTIVEKLEQVMPLLDFEMASFMSAHLKEKGVDCVLGDGIQSFSKNGNRLLLKTENGKTLECDMAILSIGVKPENRLAREAGLDIGRRGGIRVSATMQTSDPDIYAVGDAVEGDGLYHGFYHHDGPGRAGQ